MRSDLDLTPEEIEAAAAGITRMLATFRADRETAPVLAGPGGAALAEALGGPLPREGASLESLLDEVRRTVVPACRRNDSPRFFGYVCSGGSDVGTLADYLASGLNQNVTAWRSAPSATELERIVIEWIRQIVGMPAGSSGLLLGGGTAATLTALAAARDSMAGADVAAGGLLTLGREMTLYASDEVHMSAPRAAALLGMGREALRRIPSRPDFTLDVEALQRAVEKDRGEGRLPFCVVASAGATATGAIDPIGEIADLCARERLWLHVDAAYGGFATLSSSGEALSAIGRADSVAIDPHKWLHVPFDCGALVVRDPRALAASFSEVGSYARTDEKGDHEGWTFFEHGPELSRRFRALKVWMLLRHLGCDRVGRMIDHDIGVARHLAAEIEAAPDMELMAPVPLSIVCFRYCPEGVAEEALDALNRRLLKDVQSRAVAYPTHAVLKGQFALRACILNPRTTESDVETLLAEVRAAGRGLTDGRSGDRS